MQEPKKSGELAAAYEERTWHFRLHINDKDEVYIPPMALKNCLSEIAKYLGKQIPGKGKSTWTKHFEAGLLVMDPIMLGVKKKDVAGEWLYLNSDGVRGSGKHVWKKMPVIPSWSAIATIHVLDDLISKDVFEEHLTEAGKFIGLGRFRPRQNGFYGRFAVKSTKWAAA